MQLATSLKFGLFFLLVTLVTDYVAGDGCGGNLENKTGNFFLTPSINQTECKWYIIAGNASQVMLHFSSLKLGLSNLTIQSGNDSTSPSIVQFTNHTGTVTVISHEEITPVIFTRGANDTNASFDVAFNSEKCLVNYTAQSGVINSPVYRANSGDVKCSYQISLPNNLDVPVISFPKWTLTNATLKLIFDKKDAENISSSDDVLGEAGTKNVTLSMKINNGSSQMFQSVYQMADKACSGIYHTNSSGTVGTLKFPESNTLPIQCYAQIIAAETNQIYLTNKKTGSSLAGGDSVLILDGVGKSAFVLGNFNGGTPWLVSSSNKVTVVASLGTKTSRKSSLNYMEDGFSKLYRLNGTQPSVIVSLNGTQVNGRTVRIQVQSPTMVKVNFMSKTSPADRNITLTVQDSNAKTLFVFKRNTVMFPVNSPAGGAMVIVDGLTGSINLQITVSQSTSTNCNQLYQGTSGMIISKLNENSTPGCVTVISTGKESLSTILQLDSATLCKNSTVDIYEGTSSIAAKLGTINSTNSGSSLPQIQFPAGSQPRLQWTNIDTSCQSQNLMAKYWSVPSVCGTFVSGHDVKTPNFPNQYPLNAKCTWPITAKNKTLLYLSANTVQFGEDHSIKLMKNSKASLTNFSGSTLPNDQIFPNDDLSMVFSSKIKHPSGLDIPGQGADITYRLLSCGGSVSNSSTLIANPNVTSAVECIWIIEVPAKGENSSVNIVSANISVTGNKSSTSSKLEIRDGGSVRASLLHVDLTAAKIPTILSRINVLWIRYVSENGSNAETNYNFKLKYIVYNCNKTSQCDNGICLHPDWRCDGHDNCGDGTDERHCNGTQPIPTPTPPQPAPHGGDEKKGGVAAYWVVICLILGVVIGVSLMVFVPKILRRARLRNYHSFNTAENA